VIFGFALFINKGVDPMIRTMLAVVSAAAIGLGVCAAVAQEDPIKTRKELMKSNGDQAKIGAAMAKGEAPFDLTAAQKIFATFQNTASKAPALFPESSKAGVAGADFNAGPKIWENMDDFKARFNKFGDDAKAAAGSVKDLDSFKAAFGNIGKNDCGACHETYRLKKS
jgi:cytochrome c556